MHNYVVRCGCRLPSQAARYLLNVPQVKHIAGRRVCCERHFFFASYFASYLYFIGGGSSGVVHRDSAARRWLETLATAAASFSSSIPNSSATATATAIFTLASACASTINFFRSFGCCDGLAFDAPLTSVGVGMQRPIYSCTHLLYCAPSSQVVENAPCIVDRPCSLAVHKA